MKPQKTTLVKIGYSKNKNRYFATFKVQKLDKNEIGQIIAYCEMSKPQKDRKIYIKDADVYVTDFFEADFFESLYPFMIEPARQGVVPERVKPSILNVEVDLCTMEHDVDFSVRRAPNLIQRYKEALEEVDSD